MLKYSHHGVFVLYLCVLVCSYGFLYLFLPTASVPVLCLSVLVSVHVYVHKRFLLLLLLLLKSSGQIIKQHSNRISLAELVGQFKAPNLQMRKKGNGFYISHWNNADINFSCAYLACFEHSQAFT